MKKLITLILMTILSLVSCEVDEILEIDVCCKFTEAGVTDYEIVDFEQCKNYEPNMTGIAVAMSICDPSLLLTCCAHTDDGWNYTFIIKDKSTCRDTPQYWEHHVNMELCN